MNTLATQSLQDICYVDRRHLFSVSADEIVERAESLARVFAANRDRGTIRGMAEDLVLFAALCRDVATASRSNWIVAEEVQKLTHEFLVHLQSTKVPHSF